MRKLLLTVLLLLAPLAAATTDISGKWSGSMTRKTDNGSIESTAVVAEFKLDGKTVTGTAGAAGQEALPLEKGTFDGDQLTFEAHAPDGIYRVRLSVVSASELKGEVTFTDATGRNGTASIAFSRN